MAYYNCLLFDVDDTLLDFGAAERAALGEMLEHFQLPADEETIAAQPGITPELAKAIKTALRARIIDPD